MAIERLAASSMGFRSRYLDHEGVTRQLHAWASAFPDLVRVESIGVTPEGRDVWVATIGTEPDRWRPAMWVDGNMHAGELAGSSVALAIAEDALAVHLGESPHALSSGQIEALRAGLLYVCPRVSPDGAEAVLKTGRYFRSVPRDERAARGRPRWVGGDVDGDGLSLLLRKQDPTGEFVESREIPGLMVLREPEDDGPFWKVWPEGTIEGFDGVHVPDPDFLTDNAPDLNRNFPWAWVPDHEQVGAGRFPGSEPESRAVIEFASRRRHLFAWINLHTYGGVFIRPRGDVPDTRMDQADLALYRLLGAWAEEITGYPMVSGYEEFTYEPDKPLRGDLTEWAYMHLGCVAFVVELWDIHAQIGKERTKRFVDVYNALSRADLHALARWDAAHNAHRVVRPWVGVDHPQLGQVEVGGLDVRVGLWNPPYERLPEVCERLGSMALRTAALAPRIRVEASAHPLADGATRVEITAENTGYLPTWVLSSARALDFAEPLYAVLEGDGCDVLPAHRRLAVGHLDGWGRGRHDGTNSLAWQRSRGTTGRRRVEAVVTGHGTVRIRLGSARTGFAETTITV